METRLEIFDARTPELLNAEKDKQDKNLLKEGWRHESVSLAVNSHSCWYVMAVIYKREHQSPPPTR